MWLGSALRLLQKNQFPDKGATTDQKKHVMQMGLETFCAQIGFETFMGRCQETSHLLFKCAERIPTTFDVGSVREQATKNSE